MADKITQAQTISKNIKDMRESRGWNQTRLAHEAGITAAALSMIEKRDGRMPTIVLLRKIASALKVRLNEITGEERAVESEAEGSNREFYRKWYVLESLSPDDQTMLKEMAERLKDNRGIEQIKSD